jgi:PPP family 3-phenylpropionic acid transporter
MTQQKSIHLNLRYMLTSGAYFAMQCPGAFMSAYLLDKGMVNTVIGIVLGISQLLVTILQPVIAARVDRNPRVTNAMVCVLFALAVIAASFGLFFQRDISFFMILFTVLFTVSISLMQPFINALAFDYEMLGFKINFGLGRGIGSAAFAGTSYALGIMMKTGNPLMLPVFAIAASVFFLLVLTWFSSGRIRCMHSGEGLPPTGVGDHLFPFMHRHRRFVILQLGGICLFFGHMLINTYLLQIERNVGGDSGDMGIAMFAAALVEVPVMFFSEKLDEKIGCGKLLVFSGAAFSVKILLTALAASPSSILAVQLLEAFSFSVYLPAAVYYAKHLIHEKDQAKAQSFVVWAISAGSIAAAFLGGYLLDRFSVRTALMTGFFISVIGTAVVAFSREPFPSGDETDPAMQSD